MELLVMVLNRTKNSFNPITLPKILDYKPYSSIARSSICVFFLFYLSHNSLYYFISFCFLYLYSTCLILIYRLVGVGSKLLWSLGVSATLAPLPPCFFSPFRVLSKIEGANNLLSQLLNAFGSTRFFY